MKCLLIMLVCYFLVVVLCVLFGVCNGYISLGLFIGSVFLIGGMLFGLFGGQLIVLFNNGCDLFMLVVNGLFVFGGLVLFDGSYVVMISMQFVLVNCVVINVSGMVNGDVNNVQVMCQVCQEINLDKEKVWFLFVFFF